MTESQDVTPPPEPVQPVRDMRLVEVTPVPPPLPAMRDEGPRDLTPIVWGGGENDYTDFRPNEVPSNEPDPKVSSAVGSADFSVLQADLIPELEDGSLTPSANQVVPASVEKDSPAIKPPAPLKPPSSPSPKGG